MFRSGAVSAQSPALSKSVDNFVQRPVRAENTTMDLSGWTLVLVPIALAATAASQGRPDSTFRTDGRHADDF